MLIPHRARQEIPSDFRKMFGPAAAKGTTGYLSKIFDLDIEFTIDEVPKIYRYLVHHTMIKSSGHEALDHWARDRKLFAWVAVAAPIEVSNQFLQLQSASNSNYIINEFHSISCNSLMLKQHHEAFVGRLFSTLRLPILTNHPVHLHGLFSITPDRGRLTSSGQSPGSEDFATKWNNFLFTDCISSAWADLLEHRSPVSWYKEHFSLWPRVTALPIDQWNKLDDNVIDKIIKNEIPVWPTAKKCVSIHQGFFALAKPETARYASALTEAQIAAVYLEQPLFQKLQQRDLTPVQINWMTSKTVRQFLRSYKNSSLRKMPRSLLDLLLEYCLLDVQQMSDGSARKGLYDDLDGISLWPTLDGSLSATGKFDLLLARDVREMELFANSRKATTLDMSGLTNQTVELLRRDITLLSVKIRYRRLADLSDDWPAIYPAVEPPDGPKPWKIRPPRYEELIVNNVWSWICERLKEGDQWPSQLNDLWLLPTNNLRLRRYASDLESQPILIITKSEPLFDVVESMVLRDPETAPPILDTKVLPAVAVKLLQKNARSIPKLQGATVDHLETVLAWLVAGKELLATTPNRQKRTVLQHIEKLVRNKGSIIDETHQLASQIRSLPIFTRISSTSPFVERLVTLSDLQSNIDGSGIHKSSDRHSTHVFEAPVDLPPIPEISGLSFYDLSSQGERYLVERFDLIEKINVFDLLKHHLLPWAVTVQEGLMITAKEALIEFTFKYSRHATKSWATDVSKVPIIPLPLSDKGHGKQYRCLSGMVDPTSKLSELYFEKEGVFPCPKFFQRHKEALKACGIRSAPSWDTPLDRVQYYSQCGADIASLEAKVKCLLRLPIHEDLSSSESSVAKIRTLRWLPSNPVLGSTIALLSSRECRGLDEFDLVNHILGTTRFSVNKEWKNVLGWDERIELKVILQQLASCLVDTDHGRVDRVLNYLESNFTPAEYSVLKSKPCILGVRKNYLVPKNTFATSRLLGRYPMAPYLDEVDNYFARGHAKLLSELGVRSEPSIQDLLEVQVLLKDISKGPLEDMDLHVAIASLEIAARLAKGQEMPNLLVPDTESILRELSTIVYGDRGVIGTIAAFNFTHPKISDDLIQRLGIEHSLARATRLEIEFEDEDEDEYTPRETLSTVISDTLGRYPIDSTFNEFLANADDCHATTISWILDECESGPHDSQALLTSGLKSLQGPALFAYNDEGQLHISHHSMFLSDFWAGLNQ